MRGKFTAVNAGHHIGVVKEIEQLFFHVTVIDIDRYCANLEAGQHGLEVFIAVIEVQANVVILPDALGLQVVSELLGALFELFKRVSLLTADQSCTLRHLVGDHFKQIRYIEVFV